MPINLPFHSDSGIQTSILMSESLDGFSVAATRQNGGRFRIAGFEGGPVPPLPGDGGLNSPLVTDSASVIVVFGNLAPVRLSQVWGGAARLEVGTIRGSANEVMRAILITTP
jgi:hypothetical protein